MCLVVQRDTITLHPPRPTLGPGGPKEPGRTWYAPSTGLSLRACSSSSTRPPGFTTRAISRTAASGSGITHKLRVCGR